MLASIADPVVRLLAGEIGGVAVRGLYVQTIVVLIIGLLLVAGAAPADRDRRAEAIHTGVRNGWDKLRKRQGRAVSTR